MHHLTHPALFRQSCYINGQWVDSDKNPVTNLLTNLCWERSQPVCNTSG